MSIKCRRGSVLWRDICDFFFVFSAENCFFSAVFGVFVSTSREREECLFSRGADSFFAFLSRRRRCPFFSQKENKQSSCLSFASLSVFLLFFFRSFHRERETCVLRRKVISHVVII